MMKRIRILAVILFAMLTSLALFLTGAGEEALTGIAPGVWFREGEIALGHSNNVIIEMRDYFIVVDANFPSGARATLADIRKLSRKPVKYVFITHHHGDHAYGSAIWTMEGATTIAYQGVLEEFKRYEPERWREAQSRNDVRELKHAAPELPMQTFEKSPFTLTDGRRMVEFRFFGWAHTRGDGFAYLPKEQILCTGDAVVNGAFNYTGDANLGNWPAVIRAAAKLPVKHVLPGHGPPGGRELMTGQEQFLAELHRAVKAAVAQGRRLEQLVKIEDGKPVSSSLQLSPAVRHWVGESFPVQVRDAYQEITLNKPRGELQGGR
jgi:glyoxylase-like metal-dependent hydrolase (beta-lactamase superfamily II)